MTKMTTRLGLAALGLALIVPTAASAAPRAPHSTIDPWLAGELARTAADADVRVMINADDLDDALAAVDAGGLTLLTTFDRVGVAVAAGTPVQVRDAADEPGVVAVEGADRPLELFMDTSHRATLGLGGLVLAAGLGRRRTAAA